MSGDGLVAPLNAPPAGAITPGVQPGVSQAIILANIVVVFGTNGGVFIYSGTPALGNPPVYWITNSSLTDPYGNSLPAIQGSLANFGGSNWQAFSTANGFLQWFFGTAKTGPWSNGASIVAGNNLNGDLELDSNCATISEFYLGNGQILLTFPSTFGALTGVSVVPGKGITAQVNQLDEMWHTLTWTGGGAFTGVSRYRLMPDNSVRIQVDGSFATSGSPTATLPAGYRPANNAQWPMYGALRCIVVAGTGALTLFSETGGDSVGFIQDVPLD